MDVSHIRQFWKAIAQKYFNVRLCSGIEESL